MGRRRPENPEPKPEKRKCVFTPRAGNDCVQEARRRCGTCVTSKCKVCRKIFVKYCIKPRRFNSTRECMESRVREGRRGRRYEAKIRAAMVDQCRQHSCAGGENPEPKTCVLRRKSHGACDREARRLCGTCVTSKCKVCRRIFNKYCTNPRRFNSAQECMASRVREGRGRRYEPKIRQAMIGQCREHSCARGPAPEQPEPKTCVLRRRGRGDCKNEARRRCGTCVTSKCKVCRKIFVKYCTRPIRYNSAGECMSARIREGRRGRKYQAKIRAAMKDQCREHSCGQKETTRRRRRNRRRGGRRRRRRVRRTRRRRNRRAGGIGRLLRRLQRRRRRRGGRRGGRRRVRHRRNARL